MLAKIRLTFNFENKWKQAGAELGQAQVSYTLALYARLKSALTALKLYWLNPVDQIKLKQAEAKLYQAQLSLG